MTTNSKNILNKIKECTEGSEVKVTFEDNGEMRIEEGVVTSISKPQKQITIENDTDEWIFDFKDIIDIEIEENFQQQEEKTLVNNNKQISKIKDIILIVIISIFIATTVLFGGFSKFDRIMTKYGFNTPEEQNFFCIGLGMLAPDMEDRFVILMKAVAYSRYLQEKKSGYDSGKISPEHNLILKAVIASLSKITSEEFETVGLECIKRLEKLLPKIQRML